jgi:hypothetical protein
VPLPLFLAWQSPRRRREGLHHQYPPDRPPTDYGVIAILGQEGIAVLHCQQRPNLEGSLPAECLNCAVEEALTPELIEIPHISPRRTGHGHLQSPLLHLLPSLLEPGPLRRRRARNLPPHLPSIP